MGRKREVKSHSTRLSSTLILRNRNDTTQELVTVYVLANTALSPEHIKTRKKEEGKTPPTDICCNSQTSPRGRNRVLRERSCYGARHKAGSSHCVTPVGGTEQR